MSEVASAPMGADVAASLPEGSVPSAEYAATMSSVQHSDPVPAGLVSKTARPDHVPEKFWDPVKGEARWDDLAKSYAELEKMRGAKPADTPPAPDASPEAAPADPKIERKVEEVNPVTAAVESLSKAYADNGGKVDDAQLEALEALGLPKQTVETYFAGLQALQAMAMQDIHKAAGGEEAFNAAQAWAAQPTGLNDADLAYYNANIDDPAKRSQTVEWLMGKFNAARPSEGKLVSGLTPSASAGDVYSSQAQVTEAMSDNRYRLDPAFRQAVAEKLMRSKRAGSINNVAAEFHRRTR